RLLYPELLLSMLGEIPLIWLFFELSREKSTGTKVAPSDQPSVSKRKPL
ncbi:hypothetical protein SAMN05421839_1071, partial [Halolactibacillus halophilus]